MKHDPHYRQIIEGLKGELDPDVFELCVPDLLRKYDGLFAVPIKGGGDSGMDGAVADEDGERIPIISTIGNDVSGNMKKNLKRYKCDGGLARVCIVATSRSLSGKRQLNLEKKARELGFGLRQIVDQSGIAQRLYHDSKWCKELLQLTGKPSALSVIPQTHRPLPESDLIGRTEAKNWLRNSHGDRLLVGDPGAGKTSLLCEWAKDDKSGALFLVDDSGEIANAVRDQQPKAIIVDDAHKDIGLLTKLQRLRREIRAEFDIVATSWKGDGPDIVNELSCGPANVHELIRLTQEEIAEIVIDMGIPQGHWLVNEIMRQAGGLPGLAGTLTYFALQGRWREIYTGDALATDIIRFYKNRIKSDVAGLLACFAIGGKSGMAKDAVCKALDMPTYELRQDLSNLAHGGIIAELPNRKDIIMVRPSPLRHVLIRDIFFTGPDVLPDSCIQDLLAAAPELIETVRELIHVTRRWGNVPPSLLQTLLKEFIDDASRWLSILPSSPLGYTTPTLEAVREYAWLGPEEANWVMDNFTASPSHIARPLLERVPERVIPLLLNEAVGRTRPLDSHTEQPLGLLRDWIMRAHQTEEPVQRRARILHSAKSWLSCGHDPAIGYGAMLLAVIPTVQYSENQPEKDVLWLRSGFLNEEHLLRLQEFWNVIVDSMSVVEPTDWDGHFTSLAQWAFPMDCPNDDIREILTAFGETMVLDIASAFGGNVALLHRLKAFTIRAYPHLEIISDPVVNTLYPIQNFEEDEGAQKNNWAADVSRLAETWSQKEPIEVISILEPIERDLLGVHGILHRYTGDLCQLLSQNSAAPLKWFTSFSDSSLPADTAVPFLIEAVEQEVDGWESALQAAFDTDKLKASAVSIILTNEEDVSMALKEDALRDASQYPALIKHLVRSSQLSEAVTLELYNHSDKVLVSRVALEQWKQKDRGSIPTWIRPQWEKAIISHVTADYATVDFEHVDYWLQRVFASEPELGKRWLEQRFKDDSFTPFRYEKSIAGAIAGLSAASRQRFLELIPDGYLWSDTAALLVGDSHELFEKLLSSPRSELDVLMPLSRPTIDSEWIKFAKLASQHGFSAKRIVSSAFSDSTSWSGAFSDVSKGRYKQFEPFLTSSDPEVQRIAKAGRDYYFAEYESWRQQERVQEVFGRE